MAKNPFEGGSQSTQRPKVAALEAELEASRSAPKGDPGRRQKDIMNELILANIDLQRIIRAEKARLKADGRFDTGIGSRLPGANERGLDLADGAIIGREDNRRLGTIPFTQILINGIF